MATARARVPDPMAITQLLELHPFPSEHAQLKRIERLWVFDLPGTPAELWPFISDTSRMNRALGTAEMTFVEMLESERGTGVDPDCVDAAKMV